MSSAIFMDHVHGLAVDDNPYYLYFRDMHGRGADGIGEVYGSEPEFQRGYGIMSRYAGHETRAQLGSGFRSWLGNVYQFAKPYLKKGIKAALNFGTKVVHDILDGETATASVKKRVKEVAKTSLPQPLSNFVSENIGSGARKQRGGSKKNIVKTKKGKKQVKKTRLGNKRFSALKLIPE
jgi:hypothetical protein